jgi:hypothetical protein
MFSPTTLTDGQRTASYYVHLILTTRITDLRSALSHIEHELALRATRTTYEYTEHELEALRDIPIREWKP